MAAVTHFFSTGFLHKEWNATAITLAPRTSCPNTMKDYRPIAVLLVAVSPINVLLKFFLIVCNLPSFVNQYQSVFAKNWSIANMLLMQELVRNYHTNDGPASCTIKIDQMKAYDYVDWEFLFDVMTSVDSPQIVVHWVRQYASSARFTIIH